MSNKLVYIIDDDNTVCEFLQAMCRNNGFDAHAFNHADEFLKALEDQDPFMIFIDLNLGQSDGVELFRVLKEKRCKSKIIVVSSSEENILKSVVMLAQSEQLDIICALRKPLDPEEVKSILISFLDITHDVIMDSIKNNRFALYYQPQLSMTTRKVLCAEALLRWTPHAKLAIGPEAIVPIAEDTNAIHELTDWVNQAAVKHCAEWKKKGWDLQVAINISAKMLDKLALPNDLETLAVQNGITPKDICIEVTETAALKNIVTSLDVLTRFRIKGFSVSIDDFGTAYSSLVELQRAPCNQIKIDKAFSYNFQKDTPQYIIVRAIINMGHDFGLKIVAEGVEDLSTYSLLKELGCDFVQGHFIARPMPAADLMEWMKINVDENMVMRSSL